MLDDKKILIISNDSDEYEPLINIINDTKFYISTNISDAFDNLKSGSFYDALILSLQFENYEDIYKYYLDKKKLIYPIIGIISKNNIVDFESFNLDEYIVYPYHKPIVKTRILNAINSFREKAILNEQIENLTNVEHSGSLALKGELVAKFRIDVNTGYILNKLSINNDIFKNDSMTILELIDNNKKHFSSIENYKEYRELFIRENIINKFNNKENDFSIKHGFFIKDRNEVKLITKVNIYQNPMNKRLELSINIYDVSDIFIRDRIQSILLKKSYDSIGIIIPSENKLRIYDQNIAINDELSIAKKMTVDYDSHLKKVAKVYVSDDDYDFFIEKSSIDNIVEKLNQRGTYFFNVKCKDDGGGFCYKKYEYYYLDDEHTKILSSIYDSTKLLERDPLTGELNRTGFDHMAHALLTNSDKKYSILYFNQRRFKAINELFGIEFGDALLRDFPRILRQKLKPNIIARLIADSFVCLIEQDKLDYKKLEDATRTLFTYKGKTITVNNKVGVYHIEDNTMNISSMIARAKLARKDILNEYVHNYAIFNKEMQNHYLTNAISNMDLDRALSNEEFVVYYQPIYDVKTKKIVSSEALVRWNHPELGMISPGLFIPALEESGVISKLDLFVVSKTKEMIERRKKTGKNVVPISSNLSRMDFFDNNMMNELLFKLNDSDDKLRIEVTETTYGASIEHAKVFLDSFRDMGVQIYVDDFGSGYSSFSTIADYDFDILKLDMSFIKKINLNDKINGIISSVIDMAHNIGLKVVAEGVETEEQYNFLRIHDCDYIQGYYFSRPLSLDNYEQLLDNE